MTGFEVMDAISGLPRSIPVIVLTGMTSKEIIVECLRRGAHDYLSKPFDEQELKNRISNVLEKVRLEREKILIEERLKLQEVYFQQLFENSPEGIVILDNEENVIDANRSFEQIFQYNISDINRKSVNDLIVPGPLKHEIDQLTVPSMHDRIIKKETVRQKKDKSLIDVEILSYPIIHNGKKIGAYGIYTDISKRRHSEEKLQKTLEQLRKSMGAIIHAMALTVEVRDPYTAGHQQRVSSLAKVLQKSYHAHRMRLTGSEWLVRSMIWER